MLVRFLMRAAMAALLVSSMLAPRASSAADSDIDPNLTGLPAYPHLKDALMMGGKDSKGCMVYHAQTLDRLADVVAWYRAHGAGAPQTSSNSYDGTQADFGYHERTQIIAFDTSNKKLGVSIVLSKGCAPTRS